MFLYPSVRPVKLILLFIVFFCSCQSKQEKVHGHPEYFDAVIEKAREMRNGGNGLQAKAYLDSTYAAYPGTPAHYDLYRKYDIIGFYYTYIAFDYPKALLYMDSMVRVIEPDAENHAHDYIVALFGKGYTLMEQNRYNAAFQCFYTGKLFAEKHLDTCYYAWGDNSLGIVLYKQQKYSEAISYFRKAYDESARCDTTNMKSSFVDRQMELNNIALCYENMGKTDSALLYYQKALDFIDNGEKKFPESAGFAKVARGVVYGNLGGIYARQGKTGEAEKLFKESIEINSVRGNENKDAQLTAVKLGYLYLNTGRFDKTSETINGLKRWLDTLPFDESKLRLNQLVWNYYDTLGEVSKAYAAYKDYIWVKDSLASERKDLAGADVNREFLTLSQNYELDALKKKNETKNIYLIAVWSFAILLAVIFYLVWKNFRQSKNSVVQLTELNTQMKEAMRDLEQSQEENTRMMKIVAHDLRSPVGAIVGLTNIMLDDDTYSAEQKEMLGIINTSALSSIEFINDLLHVSSAMTDIQKEPVEMSKLLQYGIGMLQFKAIEKQQNITLHAKPVTLNVNREKIWRVISNLITNAIKFSPKNSVIDVTMEQGDNAVLISVHDNGIGVPDELKDKIFNMFTEAKRKGTDGEQSFGLGLAISKQIVEAHEGKMWVESEPGKGTTFFVQLPL